MDPHNQPLPGAGVASAEFRPTRYRPPAGATRALLVRHGLQAAYRPHEDSTHQGDPPLAPGGQRQAQRLAARLAEAGVSAICTSPARRARETAEPLARLLELRPRVVEGLREVGLGEWEGGTVHQRVREKDPAWARVLETERWDAIPGAETNEELHSRVARALLEVREEFRGQVVAVFTHDGVIAAALALAARASSFAFASSDHGSISELVLESEGSWRVRSFNDTSHLRVREAGRP
ncbi:MAG: histidine phosphatase family protein [Candidatus Dormibacteraeota bacterium]|nr:histidine phosphatase family protein [Candidatus Dormibacteraeota bacterium]